jgi:hypothetical protein
LWAKKALPRFLTLLKGFAEPAGAGMTGVYRVEKGACQKWHIDYMV